MAFIFLAQIYFYIKHFGLSYRYIYQYNMLGLSLGLSVSGWLGLSLSGYVCLRWRIGTLRDLGHSPQIPLHLYPQSKCLLLFFGERNFPAKKFGRPSFFLFFFSLNVGTFGFPFDPCDPPGIHLAPLST